jgi:hypothetical protein
VSVEDDERSVRPSTNRMTEKCWKIRELVHKGRWRTIHELADTIGISYGVCQENLTENVNMCHIAPSSQQRTHISIPENHRVCD